MTELYTIEIPLRLAVEANSTSEARSKLLALYRDAMDQLPTGAGVFMKDAQMLALLADVR
jgi:hypothetical protein